MRFPAYMVSLWYTSGNAKIWNTQCPMRWDKTSHPLGQPASTVVTTIGSVASYTICRKRTKTGIPLFSGEGKILTTPYYTVAYTFYLTE